MKTSTVKKPPPRVKTPTGDLTPRKIANRVVKTSKTYLQALRKAIYMLNRDKSRRSVQTYEQLKNDIIRSLRRHYKMPATAKLNKAEAIAIHHSEASGSVVRKFSIVPATIPLKITTANYQKTQQRVNRLETADDLTAEETQELDKLQKLLKEYDEKEAAESHIMETAASMFGRRHYDWLAHFAAHHLNEEQTHHLANKLQEENPNFKPPLFHNTVRKHKAKRSA